MEEGCGHRDTQAGSPSIPLLHLFLFAPPFLSLPLCAFVPRKSPARSFGALFNSDCLPMLEHTVSLRCIFCQAPKYPRLASCRSRHLSRLGPPFSPSFILHPPYTPLQGCSLEPHTQRLPLFAPPPPDLLYFIPVMNKGPWHRLPLLPLSTHTLQHPSLGLEKPVPQTESSAESRLTSHTRSTCTSPATGSSLAHPERPRRHFGDRLH